MITAAFPEANSYVPPPCRRPVLPSYPHPARASGHGAAAGGGGRLRRLGAAGRWDEWRGRSRRGARGFPGAGRAAAGRRGLRRAGAGRRQRGDRAQRPRIAAPESRFPPARAAGARHPGGNPLHRPGYRGRDLSAPRDRRCRRRSLHLRGAGRREPGFRHGDGANPDRRDAAARRGGRRRGSGRRRRGDGFRRGAGRTGGAAGIDPGKHRRRRGDGQHRGAGAVAVCHRRRRRAGSRRLPAGPGRAGALHARFPARGREAFRERARPWRQWRDQRATDRRGHRARHIAATAGSRGNPARNEHATGSTGHRRRPASGRCDTADAEAARRAGRRRRPTARRRRRRRVPHSHRPLPDPRPRTARSHPLLPHDGLDLPGYAAPRARALAGAVSRGTATRAPSAAARFWRRQRGYRRRLLTRGGLAAA